MLYIFHRVADFVFVEAAQYLLCLNDCGSLGGRPSRKPHMFCIEKIVNGERGFHEDQII
jgi:hypothetical protein